MEERITLEVIAARLDDLRTTVKDIGQNFVAVNVYEERHRLYDSQRLDQGRRIGELEKQVARMQAKEEAQEERDQSRYRTMVNLFVAAGLGFAGSIAALIIQSINQ